ncbi:(d)CMP kinase [Porphyromonas cangingivalis]|uniref:Cytidylate kinase n=1 Tax=Porphyromonas cangingivalis TaxID=36874 RepID=A0A1T4KBM8_PORCN|nr:(d)CMP kinase [Porphyromonas cangingivalis]SJZ39858.1 cytidylate kinase [Porphyromonas cangingivalis]VEJ02837.1 Cytidylate kinase [Porphyromonas cangingivalis]
MKRINIALDGHSSCGKSTMAKVLAKRIGYTYIDTGAMYRGVTLFSIQNNLWDGDKPLVDEIVRSLDDITLRFKTDGGANRLLLNGEDVEDQIRGMEVSNKVSPISTIAEVRAFLVKQQQEMATEKGVVMDGRDIGTVVLPDAELKVFVTASAKVRAQRRYDELRALGKEVTYDEVYQNVVTRDRIDSTREASPLKQAEDAVLLDNSDLTRDEQNEILYRMFVEKTA